MGFRATRGLAVTVNVLSEDVTVSAVCRLPLSDMSDLNSNCRRAVLA